MQGIIFNLLGEKVSEAWGEDYWDDLVRRTPGVDNPVFVGPKNYPDEALSSLLTRIASDKGVAVPDLLRSFGRWAFPRLAEAHRPLVQNVRSAKDFLKIVENVIHTEVRKLYDDAYLPRITYEDPDPRTLIMVYSSKRRLCRLAEGLIQGVGDFRRASLRVSGEMHPGGRSRVSNPGRISG